MTKPETCRDLLRDMLAIASNISDFDDALDLHGFSTDRIRAAMAERPTTQPLTREQIMALPDGARVVVVWDGGNSPHEYIVARDRPGALMGFAVPDYPKLCVGWPIDAKHVWLAED